MTLESARIVSPIEDAEFEFASTSPDRLRRLLAEKNNHIARVQARAGWYVISGFFVGIIIGTLNGMAVTLALFGMR